jgi:hypothetical protein
MWFAFRKSSSDNKRPGGKRNGRRKSPSLAEKVDSFVKDLNTGIQTLVWGPQKQPAYLPVAVNRRRKVG